MGRRRRELRWVVAVVVLTVALLVSLQQLGGRPEPSAAGGQMLADLERLPTGPIATERPYDRDEFGQRWADVDGTGCDQRNEALAAAMTDVVYRDNTDDCVVELGSLLDPYRGEVVEFVKTENAAEVHIDHVVPLAHAWAMGAAGWEPDQRERFANELAQLQATSAAANQAKGDRTPLEWMPPAAAYHCAYLQHWVDIKVRWQLAVTELERTWLAASLADACEVADAGGADTVEQPDTLVTLHGQPVRFATSRSSEIGPAV